jgi:hypothetical protein
MGGLGFIPSMQSAFVTSRSERWRLKVSDWWREGTGWLLELIHSPARLKEFEYVDPVTNQTVYLSTGKRYSVLHIGDKSLFFDRATGTFDGTGSLLEERIPNGLELLD